MSTATETESATRQCRSCHERLPLDAEHFHRHAGHKDGFREVCKECRQRLRKDGRREAYGKAEKTLLLKLAQQIRAGRDSPEHGLLLYCLNQYFGGMAGVARAMTVQYDAAVPGSQTKLSVLNTLYSLIIANDRREEEAKRKRQDKMNKMSREELDESLWDLTQQLLDKLGYDVVPRQSGK
jgi:hypothetical protein